VVIDGLPDASSMISSCDCAITQVDNLVAVFEFFDDAAVSSDRSHDFLAVFV